MTELQEARAKWLDSESRNVSLEKEKSDLMHKVFELQMKLVVSQARAQSAEIMLSAAVRAMLTV